MGHDFEELKGPWYPKYLVRPDDHAIFEIQPDIMRYGLFGKIKNKPKAYDHFTYENLVNHYGWYPINEDEIPKHQALNHRWNQIWSKYMESDGHDGVKGRDGLTPEEIDFIQLERD